MREAIKSLIFTVKKFLTHKFPWNESTIAQFANKISTERRCEIFLAAVVAKTLLTICLFTWKPDSISFCFHWLVQWNRRAAITYACMSFHQSTQSTFRAKDFSCSEKDLWKSRISSWRNNWRNVDSLAEQRIGSVNHQHGINLNFELFSDSERLRPTCHDLPDDLRLSNIIVTFVRFFFPNKTSSTV